MWSILINGNIKTMKKLYLILILLVFCFVLVIVMDKVFVLFSPVRIVNVSPSDGASDVLLDSSLVINFNKPIKRQEIQPFISPKMHGEWRFEDPLIKNHLFKTLVFVPAVKFEPGTQYQVKIENIKGFGFEKSNSFQFTFKTYSEPQDEASDPEKITMLEIPLDWQDYALSCEAASLKMALSGKGIFVSETEIMEKIGYDLGSRKGNVWGDAYERYVGDIDGKMCKTGYGVYWDPVAKAAQNWREAEAFSGWSIQDLTKEVEAGNPVIVWGALPKDTLTDCSWYTSEGKYILAYKETHVRLLIGFIGPKENPSKIILNDPLSGRLYWSASYFLENWKVFDYSGVVIR